MAKKRKSSDGQFKKNKNKKKKAKVEVIELSSDSEERKREQEEEREQEEPVRPAFNVQIHSKVLIELAGAFFEKDTRRIQAVAGLLAPLVQEFRVGRVRVVLLQ